MRGSLRWLMTAGWLCLPLALAGQAPDQKQALSDEQKLKAVDLKTDNAALLGFLKARTLNEDDRERIDLLIAKLGASSFKVREQAAQELIVKGPAILSLLRQGLNYPDLEVQRRCEVCIQKIKEHDRFAEVSSSVIRLIGARKPAPAGAADVLIAHLPFVDTDAVADDIREVLAKLAVQSGKAEKTLVAALADQAPVRRAAAGEALIVAGALDKHKKAIRALLSDPNSAVRWRVAVALVAAKDKGALPVLIDVLPDVGPSQAWDIEETLSRLAAGKSPPMVSLGADDAGRAKCRDAWQKWWKENGATVDLAVLQKPVELGWTTMVLLDRGTVLEVDARHNVRWQIDDLQYPLDIQVLDKGRVLVAEYHANRITERNFKGQILWQADFAEPQEAQRLANGNTFMASKYQLQEIDRRGDTVFTFNVNLIGAGIMKCLKTPDGEITCLYDDGRVVRMDGTGKELSSFRLQISKLYGGRLDVLPNGNVLIPFKDEGKVVEFNRAGAVVWKVDLPQPIVATRLPNGNTLVTSWAQNRAVEFDAKRNEVWEHQENTRVTRAVRR